MSTSDDTPPDLADAIDAVADEYLRALRSAEPIEVARVIEAHPELAPWLERRLALVDAFHAAARGGRLREMPERIARFQVIELLGSGTFGTVYKASDTELDRVVAVKVPRAGYFDSQEEELRFLREARSAAALKHPGIVQVYEIAEERGVPCIVSELIDGRTLAEAIRVRRPAARESAELVAQIADALDHAHRAGIVHRDVKPGNILVDASGNPHVTDFGLARREEGEATMTLEGQILGTPAYMAPEQASGEPSRVGVRSDVYSLGVVLYELLTGVRPFRGQRSQVIQQVLHDEPRPPRALAGSIPRDLERICLKAMAKEPSRRYAGARDFAKDLRCHLRGEPVLARPTGAAERAWRWARRNPAVASLTAAVFLVLAAAAAVSSALAYRADRARGDATQRLSRLNVTTGMQLVSRGDVLGALPWLAEASALDEGEPSREELHRVRFEAALDRSPKLEHVWIHDSVVTELDFSPDSRRLVWCAGPARVADLASDAESPVQLPHGGGVVHEKFSPDASLVVTAGRDGTARVWRVGSWDPAFPPLVHGGPVVHACFDRDGGLLATASHDGTARVWNAATGEPLTPPLKHNGPVNHVSFRGDGRQVVTSGDDLITKLWEVPSGKLVLGGLKHEGAAREGWFNPQGNRVLTVSGNTCGVWDAETGRLVTNAIAHRGTLFHATFSSDGRHVLTSSQDTTAALWNAETGECVLPPFQHGLGVPTAFFAPDGWRIITAGSDGVARFWDSSTGKEVLPPLYHRRGLTTARFSPDGKRVATGCWENVVRVWDFAAVAPDALFLRHAAAVRWAEISPDGLKVITASADQSARMWDARTGEPLTAPLEHGGIVNHATFRTDSTIAVTASSDGLARLWDAGTGAPRWILRHSKAVNHAAFSPDGSLVATASADSTAAIWSTETGKRLLEPLVHRGAVLHVAFSPDGKLLATSSQDGTACLWSTADGKAVVPTMSHPFVNIRTVYRSSFSPDGRRLATCSGSETAEVWSTETGGAVTPLLGHTSDVLSVAFGPDGLHVATGSLDTTARVWDARSGEPVTPPLQHGNFVNSVAFSPDGRMLLTACSDGRVRIWDAATGALVAVPIEHQAPSGCASFCPDGRQVVTASDDGTAALWSLPAKASSTEERLLWANLLSQHRIDATGGAVRLETAEMRRAWEQLSPKYPGERRASGKEVEAWHHLEARYCESERAWAMAISHIDRLAGSHTADWHLRLERAEDLAELGDLEAAAPAFEEAIRLGAAESAYAYKVAVLRLSIGDVQGYGAACRTLLERFGGDGAVYDDARTVVWACVMAPGAAPDLARVQRLAERCAELSPQAPEAHSVLAAAHFRAGKLDQAVREIEKAAALRGSSTAAGDQFILAMALRGLGKTDEAMGRLRRGEALFERKLQPVPGQLSTTTMPWTLRLRTEILQAEAAKLFGTDSASTSTLDKLLWRFQPFMPILPQKKSPAPKSSRRK